MLRVAQQDRLAEKACLSERNKVKRKNPQYQETFIVQHCIKFMNGKQNLIFIPITLIAPKKTLKQRRCSTNIIDNIM